MDKIGKAVPLVTELLKIEQSIGSVMHALKVSSIGYCGFGEAYFSTVNFQMIKGWKLHHRMTLNIIVPHGEIRFVVHDGKAQKGLRQIEPLIDVILGDSNYSRLTVPPGYWLAFQGVGLNSNILLNVASIEHDPNEAINQELDFFDVKGFEYCE